MKELSAKIKELRGQRSSQECAELAKLSKTAYLNLERGKPVRLRTLRDFAEGLKASEADWTELLCAWLKGQADSWIDLVKIEPAVVRPSALRAASEAKEEIVLTKYNNLNAAERNAIVWAISHPEVVKPLTAIHKFYS